jgi:predicted dehydrogenase
VTGIWEQPIYERDVAVGPQNSFREQLLHFLAVARREEASLVTGRDTRRTLEATLAVREAARAGRPVEFEIA